MTLYQTLQGTLYDLSTLSSEERGFFEEMYRFAQSSQSWTEFQQQWARSTFGLAQKHFGNSWEVYPLYQIQLDLVGRVGIRNGEFNFPGPILEDIVE